jgi:hypothetical protein
MEPRTDDSLLSPCYDIERIPIRIGHGFDIHRMAPIQEAGQPVVIGGVEIIHTDQKVRGPMRILAPHLKIVVVVVVFVVVVFLTLFVFLGEIQVD